MSAAGAYAARVRAALSDLPDDVRTELLDGLDEHIAVVANEADGSLADQLGNPYDYADELRRSAGLGEPPPHPPSSTRLGFGDQLRRDGRRLAETDAGRAALAFLPELRPGWWVLRGWAAVMLLGLLAGRASLLPFGLLVTVLLVAGAAVLSVRLGRWQQREVGLDQRRAVVSVLGNAALGIVAAAVLLGASVQSTPVVYASDDYQPPTVLTRSDGTPITNIYPYAATGEALEGVLLYDQDGRALDNLTTDTPDGRTIERLTLPGGPPAPANAFPQRQRFRDVDETGGVVVTPPIAPSLPSPAAPSPEVTGSPTPLPSSDASPTLTPLPSQVASPGRTALPNPAVTPTEPAPPGGALVPTPSPR